MGNIASTLGRHDQVLESKSLSNIQSRIEALKKLKVSIEKHSKKIEEALKYDLSKSAFESYLGEIDFTVHEIDHTIDNIHSWTLDQPVSSPLAFAPASSFIRLEPFGKVLIIGPWNYPFQLVMAPLIGALAAGNTVVLKPSEISERTADVIKLIVEDAFTEGEVSVVLGGVDETTELLEHPFDYIFYTGNGTVGRIVMAAAAKNLTPVTLELGGKSPCLVYSKNLDLSAKRIMWGKFFNAGQTCVAPDYILISKKDRDKFISACQKWLKHFYGESIKNSNDYGRIINEKHFDRIEKYLTGLDILVGGETDKDTKFIAPTIVHAKEDDPIMQEEIFGPILPIIEIDTIEDAISFVNKRDKPLACYGFFDRSSDKDKLIDEVSCGGMVINDTLVHLSNANLPFGGVGESGMGAYHGKFSLTTFSHKKAVMKRSFLFENSLRYPPYEGKLNFVRKILKLIS